MTRFAARLLLAATCALGVAAPASAQQLEAVDTARFATIDVFIDSSEPLAAWQFELAERRGLMTVVGVENGESDAFERQPLELVFVLDCSGSMSGEPLAQAKDAVLAALDKLARDDTFQIIRFSTNASRFGPAPVPARAENVRRAKSYVLGLSGQGGTQMIEGIKAALDFPHDPDRLRFVSFLTDGFIGNELEARLANASARRASSVSASARPSTAICSGAWPASGAAPSRIWGWTTRAVRAARAGHAPAPTREPRAPARGRLRTRRRDASAASRRRSRR